MSVLCSHSDSPMCLPLCSFISFVFSALPSGISFLPHEINIQNLLIFLDGHSVLNCVYLFLLSKKKFHWIYILGQQIFFLQSLENIVPQPLIQLLSSFQQCGCNWSFSLTSFKILFALMFCSVTVCLVWISFYLIHLEIYKLLNL